MAKTQKRGGRQTDCDRKLVPSGGLRKRRSPRAVGVASDLLGKIPGLYCIIPGAGISCQFALTEQLLVDGVR